LYPWPGLNQLLFWSNRLPLRTGFYAMKDYWAFPIYLYVHMIPTSTFRCRFVRLELLSPKSDFALTLLLIVMTHMSTYKSPMYYAVFFSLIINMLSI
jgi:hypothetical protein